MRVECPIHGSAGVCIHSPALLALQPDGTLPDMITVEVKDDPEEIAFFRFNVSPGEAADLSIMNNRIPFDGKAIEVMRGLQHMCCFCFRERRTALEAQSR